MTRTSCEDKVVFANMFMYAKKMGLIRGKLRRRFTFLSPIMKINKATRYHEEGFQRSSQRPLKNFN